LEVLSRETINQLVRESMFLNQGPSF